MSSSPPKLIDLCRMLSEAAATNASNLAAEDLWEMHCVVSSLENEVERALLEFAASYQPN